MSDLDEFNTAPHAALRQRLLALTASPSWADAVLTGRPYADLDALLGASDEAALRLDEQEVDAALAGHPRIGETAAGLDPDSAGRSSREQAGMSHADDAVRAELARGNAAYEQRFGRIYLVAAAGRSAQELLDVLDARLGNDPDTELAVVRGELARITRLRLADMFATAEAGR